MSNHRIRLYRGAQLARAVRPWEDAILAAVIGFLAGALIFCNAPW